MHRGRGDGCGLAGTWATFFFGAKDSTREPRVSSDVTCKRFGLLLNVADAFSTGCPRRSSGQDVRGASSSGQPESFAVSRLPCRDPLRSQHWARSKYLHAARRAATIKYVPYDTASITEVRSGQNKIGQEMFFFPSGIGHHRTSCSIAWWACVECQGFRARSRDNILPLSRRPP